MSADEKFNEIWTLIKDLEAIFGEEIEPDLIKLKNMSVELAFELLREVNEEEAKQ